MNHMELNPVLVERLNEIHGTVFKTRQPGNRRDSDAPYRVAAALFLQAELPEADTFESQQLETFMERAMHMREVAELNKHEGFTEGMRRSLGNQMRVLARTFPEYVPDEDTAAHGHRPSWVDDLWQKARSDAGLSRKKDGIPTKRPAAPDAAQGQENATA